jgi:hypothetical protein
LDTPGNGVCHKANKKQIILVVPGAPHIRVATLTTVGSTIAPVHPFARSLTIAEAIVGQLFPATLIGALVAMAMESRRRS